MMAVSSGELKITRSMLASLRSLVGSKFGFRVVSIFVLCALIPLTIASGFLLREFNELLSQREQRDLNALVRSTGMGLIGRLGSADDVLQGLIAAVHRPADDQWIDAQVRRFTWARSVRRVAYGQSFSRSERAPPQLSARQQLGLAEDETVVAWEYDGAGSSTVSLIRRLPSGSLLCVELAPNWLWGDLLELTEDTNLLLLDSTDRTLLLTGNQADQANDSELRGAIREQQVGQKQNPGLVRPSSGQWIVSHWVLFLNSRFHASSWQIIAYKPEPSVIAGLYSARVIFPAIVVLTLLLVSLLSLKLIRRQLRPLELLVEGTRKISRLEFTQPVQLIGSDEFTDLARSFNGMSDHLRMQFSALEAMSEIDRLLLHSPGLEPILDSVLPRISGILGCCSVSVLLSGVDAVDHGRSYDYLKNLDQRLPVRRLTTDITTLRHATTENHRIDIAASDIRVRTFLSPLIDAGAKRFRICALRHDDRTRGFLCVGYAEAPIEDGNSSIHIDDFADRLSVVLANLERTEKLYEQAHIDPLTRLPNRQQFSEKLNLRLARSTDPAEAGALLYIDLDHFKHINDVVGHTVGDEVLCAVASRLNASLDTGDMVARLGGDEFAAILQKAGDGVAARQAAQRVLEGLRAPLLLGGHEYRIEASIGITLFPADGGTIEELLKNSDIAMYRAKESGRGQAVFFEPEMQERMHARAALEAGLRRALERHEFKLLYQPIVDCEVPNMAGVEALLRWPLAPDGHKDSPARFVAVAEESDLIVGVGEWVLITACRQFNTWRSEKLEIKYLSVNVSARQLRHAGFVELVLNALKASDMRPDELHVEITEGALAEGPSVARALGELEKHGVHLALDDFGTGYSSLSYLRNFPIHSVKIDRSFITEIPRSPAACRLAESIIAMTTVLQKHVVAEGVETEAQLRFLQKAGCGSIQGYLFGRPMEAVDIPGFARRINTSGQDLKAERSAPRAAAR
jgi:diguanylate cyclase (GGDEF)-like protein